MAGAVTRATCSTRSAAAAARPGALEQTYAHSLQAGLSRGETNGEVELAWPCYQQLRVIHAGTARYLDADGLSSCGAKAINLLIEKASRITHGYGSLDNCRLCMLLAASGTAADESGSRPVTTLQAEEPSKSQA